MSFVLNSEPNIVHITPDDMLREVDEALAKVRAKFAGMAFIVLVGPRNDASRLACLTNVDPQPTQERLRNGLEQIRREGSRIVKPRA